MATPFVKASELPPLDWEKLDTRPVWRKRGRGWAIAWVPLEEVDGPGYCRCDTCGMWVERALSYEGQRCQLCCLSAFRSIGVTDQEELLLIWGMQGVALNGVILHLIRCGVISPAQWVSMV